MLEFQCWFCGEGIDRADTGAIMVTLENLWLWGGDFRSDDDPLQCIYAHSRCAKGRLQGATMDLDPNLFDERDESA